MLAKLVYAGIVFAGFLAIMNPIACISIFLTLTHGEEDEEIKKIALHSVITAFAIVVIFSSAGHILLNFFGVSFTALRLAGGILVGLIGYEMLQGKESLISKPSRQSIEKTIKEESSVAVTPLGTPLLAGPGVIITAMNFSTGTISHLIITIFAFGLLCIITYYCFILGKRIKKFLGESSLRLVTKMMGLILIFIGTQMFLGGIYSAIHDFSKTKHTLSLLDFKPFVNFLNVFKVI